MILLLNDYKVGAQLRHDLPEIFYYSCVLWLPVNFLNFLLVPPALRVLPTIAASCIWTSYLSLAAHRHQA